MLDIIISLAICILEIIHGYYICIGEKDITSSYLSTWIMIFTAPVSSSKDNINTKTFMVKIMQSLLFQVYIATVKYITAQSLLK